MTAPIRTIRIGFCAAITGGDRIVRGGGGPGAGNSTGLREREPARREGVTDILVVRADYGFRNNSGSFAILAAIRRASSLESNFTADLLPGSSSK